MADDKKPKEDAKPEKKPTRREAMYGKKSPAKGPDTVDEKGPMKHVPDGTETDELKGEADPAIAAHAAMVKRQEVERRDLHASHRGDHRLMATRHEAEMAELMGAGGETPPPADGE